MTTIMADRLNLLSSLHLDVRHWSRLSSSLTLNLVTALTKLGELLLLVSSMLNERFNRGKDLQGHNAAQGHVPLKASTHSNKFVG